MTFWIFKKAQMKFADFLYIYIFLKADAGLVFLKPIKKKCQIIVPQNSKKRSIRNQADMFNFALQSVHKIIWTYSSRILCSPTLILYASVQSFVLSQDYPCTHVISGRLLFSTQVHYHWEQLEYSRYNIMHICSQTYMPTFISTHSLRTLVSLIITCGHTESIIQQSFCRIFFSSYICWCPYQTVEYANKIKSVQAIKKRCQNICNT